jgi:hypothetical protein
VEDTARGPSPARPLFFIFGMPLVLAVLYYGWLAVQVARTRYTWKEMDWNGNGRTSVREFFQTADVLERAAADSAPGCIELYSARTGRVLRTDCRAAAGR